MATFSKLAKVGCLNMTFKGASLQGLDYNRAQLKATDTTYSDILTVDFTLATEGQSVPKITNSADWVFTVSAKTYSHVVLFPSSEQSSTITIPLEENIVMSVEGTITILAGQLEVTK